MLLQTMGNQLKFYARTISLLREESLRTLVLFAGITAVTFLTQSSSVPIQAQNTANCSGQYYVNEQLPNGSIWELCWEHRSREGIVIRDVYFTPPDGSSRKVLYEGYIAQIHVPYDDNGTRYHDITDYGIGNANMKRLVPAECPNGTLLLHGAKEVVCQRISPRGHAYKAGTVGKQGDALSIFSVSQVGSYSYIPLWQFFDDGTIAPAMGATGKLQRRGPNNSFGWPIRSNFVTGISHTHNYYWYLDFELGEDGTDDVVEEIEFTPSNGGAERILSVNPLTTEAARSVNPEKMRSWRIRDGLILNGDRHAVSYELMPLGVGHRDEGPVDEPWTLNDFYVTKYNPCEEFVSHNSTANGCGDNVSEFVDGESLTGEDPVLWFGLTFHHTPRDEDETFMHAHWDGFQVVPRDWTAVNPLVPTPTPTVTNTPTVTDTPTVTYTPSSTPVPSSTPTVTRTPTPTETSVAPTSVSPTATTILPTATSVPPTSVSPTSAPPMSAPPTSAPPTSVPPTAVPTSTIPVPIRSQLSCAVYTSADTPLLLDQSVASIESALIVSPSSQIIDLNVELDLTHDWVGDLTIKLLHQNTGTIVTLLERPGSLTSQWGCNYDDIAVTLDDNASSAVSAACINQTPAIDGTLQPQDSLSVFNDTNGQGTWILTVDDAYDLAGHGALNGWQLELCSSRQYLYLPLID